MDEEVSVIISTLNEEDNIKDCIDCLINQTEKPLEIIVIDNGSVDKTRSIAKDLKKKFKNNEIKFRLYYYPYGNEINARGFGVKKSKGTIIASIDADARADREWISKIKKHFKDSEVVGIGGKSRYRNRGAVINFFYLLTYYLRLVANLYCIGGGNSAFRKSTFFSVKGYSGLDKLRREENIAFAKDDFFLSKKLEQKGRLKFCPDMKVTLLYRIRVNENKNYKNIIPIKDILNKSILGTIYDLKITKYFKKKHLKKNY